jgi:voltage-gated potassium channel
MSPAKPVVRLAYSLQASERYRRYKTFFYDLLQNPRSPQRPYFDVAMIVVVVTSVILLLYDVRHDFGPLAARFETLAVSLFILEYLLRLWVYSDSHTILIAHYERAELLNTRFRLLPALGDMLRSKFQYVTTPLAIIDLLAILPSYRPLRFLRIFLLFRLLKLFRYTRSLNAFAGVLAEKRFEFLTLAAFLGFAILIASSAIYVVEVDDPGSSVNSFVDAVYWAVVTVSTVGYGDIVPKTTEGRAVTAVLIVAGIGVLAFSTSIIVAAFSEKMPELRENRVLAELEKAKKLTIVGGYGRIGEVVVERLARTGAAFVVVDKDQEAVQRARKRGFLAVQGDASDLELLTTLGLGTRATSMLCLTHDDVSNLYITLTSRHADKDILIISRANRRDSMRKLGLAGATRVVRPYESVARMAVEYVGQPVAFDAVYGVVTGTKEVRLEPIAVHPDSWLEGRPIADASLEREHLLLFGVIRSAEAPPSGDHEYYDLMTRHFYFNPGPGFLLQAHDILVVFGYEFGILHFKQRLESGRPDRRSS